MTQDTTYDGHEYFWNYEYRYPMRDLTPAGRRRVHAKFVARNLELDGASPMHAEAIRDALTAFDRSRLFRCYGAVGWGWWNKTTIENRNLSQDWSRDPA